MKLKNLTALSGLCLLAGVTPEGFSAPGTITASFDTVSPIALGQTFTVTLRLGGYTDAFEIDSWNLGVSYDSSIFRYVAGSAAFGGSVGPDPQWLSKTNQNLDPTYAPTPFSDEAVTAGTLLLSLSDLGLLEFPDRGSRALDGFLVSFSLQSTNVGAPSLIAPRAPPGGSVFYDSSTFAANPGGSPTFSGALMQVSTAQPTTLTITHGSNSTVRLSWPDPGWVLQESANALGVYVNVPGNPGSPYTVISSSARKFYRLMLVP